MCFWLKPYITLVYRCRRFNAVLSMAIRENKRRVLRRMYLFSKQEYENRKFKRKQALMPLIITFRALKHNAVVNRYRLIQMYALDSLIFVQISRCKEVTASIEVSTF